MTLREAISQSFDPEVWKAIQNHLSAPELLKIACLTEFKFNGRGRRIEFMRLALIKLDNDGLISLDSDTSFVKPNT